MMRTLSILLLALLTLPYARAEICSAAGHEHPGEQHASGEHAGEGYHHDHHQVAPGTVLAESDHAAADSECHRLMACDTTVQIVMPSATVASRLEAHPATEESRLAAHVDEPAKAPIPPPPQTV